MSHPFTPDGEISLNQVNGDIESPSGNEKGSETLESQTKSTQSTCICEIESVTEGYQTDQVVAADQFEENLNVEMEIVTDEMDITITDNVRLSFFKILRMAMRRRLTVFANEVSIWSLSYLVKSSSYKVGSIIRKIIWTMLLLFGTGFMVYQIYDRITYYLMYPTFANYQVAYNRSLRFPSVTICSEVLISKKSFISMGNYMYIDLI